MNYFWKMIAVVLVVGCLATSVGCLGGQIVSIWVNQHGPGGEAPTTQPNGNPKGAGNYSNIDIDIEDGGTSLMGPAANPTPTTQPSQR